MLRITGLMLVLATSSPLSAEIPDLLLGKTLQSRTPAINGDCYAYSGFWADNAKTMRGQVQFEFGCSQGTVFGLHIYTTASHTETIASDSITASVINFSSWNPDYTVLTVRREINAIAKDNSRNLSQTQQFTFDFSTTDRLRMEYSLRTQETLNGQQQAPVEVKSSFDYDRFN